MTSMSRAALTVSTFSTIDPDAAAATLREVNVALVSRVDVGLGLEGGSR